MARTGNGVALENLGLVEPYDYYPLQPSEPDKPPANENPKSY